MPVIDIDTPYGLARGHLTSADEARAALVLGHGAGGGIQAADLTEARRAAGAQRMSVVLVEQPYRVAGRRAPPRAPVLDAAWIAIVEHLGTGELTDLPLVVGGRSMGARVACRTAEETEAVAVLCLAFPLEPPRRTDKPRQSRLAELEAVRVPTLVVQGERDPFGIPPPGANRKVAIVAGDHNLKQDLKAVSAAVESWLAAVIAAATV